MQHWVFALSLCSLVLNCASRPLFSLPTAAVVAESEMMPGQIPDPSLAAGSLPSLGPLAGISATTLTDQLKLTGFRQLGTVLSPLHFLGRLGKRPLAIKTEVGRKGKKRKLCTSRVTVWEGRRYWIQDVSKPSLKQDFWFGKMASLTFPSE